MQICLTKKETEEIKEQIKQFVTRCLKGKCTPAETEILPEVLDVLN